MGTNTVFVVDDDAAVRKSLAWLLQSVNLEVKTFESGEEFLREYDGSHPGCVLLDLRMPGMSGLTVLEELAARDVQTPAVLITAHGSVPSAVRAMRAGAINVLEKPYNEHELLDAVRESLRRDEHIREQYANRQAARERVQLLSEREREILDRIVAGKPNKQIAVELEMSEKNVEYHRANLMRKVQAGSLAELIRMVFEAEAVPTRNSTPGRV